MKENSKGGLPEASAAEPEKKKRKSATLPAVPEPAVQSESTPVAPAAEQCEASESLRKKPAEAKAKAKGRPRGPSAPAHPEGPEQEEPTAKKAKKGPKRGGIGKNGGVDHAGVHAKLYLEEVCEVPGAAAQGAWLQLVLCP